MIWLLPKGDLPTTHLPLAAALGQEQISHRLSNLSIKEISEKKATPNGWGRFNRQPSTPTDQW